MLTEQDRKEIFNMILNIIGSREISVSDQNRNRRVLMRENLGKPCKNCGSTLRVDDMLNSLYGSHYTLCKECASKISL